MITPELLLENIANGKYGKSTDRPFDTDKRKQFFQDLKEAFDMQDNPRVNLCARLAWRYGNAYSYESVVTCFEDFKELIS